MHHSLSDLPKQAVLDTNVLLDATYVSDGVARRAVPLLASLGISAVIDERIVEEAFATLEGLKGRLGLTFDPHSLLDTFIADHDIQRLPPSPQHVRDGVNRHDRHIANAAIEYEAWVLTGDTPLLVECESIGVPARLPWDVIMEAALSDGSEPNLVEVIRIVSPAQETGVIFGRVHPGGWVGHEAVGRFTVCDVENVGRIYYDTDGNEWVFDMVIGVSARVKCEINDGNWVVCGSYRLPNGASQGKVTIRAGQYPSTTAAASTNTPKHIGDHAPGTIRAGSSIRGEDNWNGHFRSVVVGPQGMNRETWRAIVGTQEGAPNPYDSNSLERILTILQRTVEQHGVSPIRVLSEEDLRG